MDRRTYPEDRGPPPAAALPPPPQPPPPAPPVEKKPEVKNVDDILKLPGRLSRPERVQSVCDASVGRRSRCSHVSRPVSEQIVIIMRGLPGSGKGHVAKLIRVSGTTPHRIYTQQHGLFTILNLSQSIFRIKRSTAAALLREFLFLTTIS